MMTTKPVKPTLPNVPTYDGKRFTWGPTKGTAELSDLGRDAGIARLWDDACDVGFYIESHRTGQKGLFVLVHQERAEGEVLSSTFHSVNLPKVVEVTLYND